MREIFNLNNKRRRGVVSYFISYPLLAALCASLAGLLQVAAFSPFGMWYLAAPSLLFLLFVFEFLPGNRGRQCVYVYGVAFWVGAVHWVYYSFGHFGDAPMVGKVAAIVLLAGGLGLFHLLIYGLYSFLTRNLGMYGYIQTPLLLKVFVFAGCWVAVEWVRSTIFQGFPWLLLGYSLVDVSLLPIQRWLPVAGIWSLSFIYTLTVASVFYTCVGMFRNGFKQGSVTGSLLLLVPILALLGSWLLPEEWTKLNGKQMQLALIQPSIPLDKKWSARHTTGNLLLLQELSEPHKDNVDVIVWPESAIAGAVQNHMPIISSIAQNIKPASLLTGTLRYGEEGQIYNSLGHLDEGKMVFYDKRQLVQFGEFVPLAFIRKLVEWLGFPSNSISPSTRKGGLLQVKDFVFASAICYEVVFPRLLNHDAGLSDAILNISDDGWFGDSIGPQQHQQMARTRAMEQGREMLRLGNDGLTSHIDHNGKVLKSLPRFARDSIEITIQGRTGATLYSHIGEWIVLLLFLLPVLAYVLLFFVYRKRIE